MTRGKWLALTSEQRVSRALANMMIIPIPPEGAPSDAGKKPIAYRLKDVNGGDDPTAAHCAGWSYGLRTPTADCIGFLLHSGGIDRKQPLYAGIAGPWLHCPSLIADAKGAQRFVELVTGGVAPGDFLLTEDHCAMILRPDPDGSGGFSHLVIDCSPRHGRDTAIGIGYPWSASFTVCRLRQPPPGS